MGKTLTPEQELEQLRALIREAHETIKDLRLTIREARQLVTELLDDFHSIADTEIKDLANWLQRENNRYATELNASVDKARSEITRQLTTTKLILDPVGNHFEVQFKPGHFDDQVPLPHPDQPVKDITP